MGHYTRHTLWNLKDNEIPRWAANNNFQSSLPLDFPEENNLTLFQDNLNNLFIGKTVR
jgi:hypothetical protein